MGRAWQLQIYVNDDKVLDKLIESRSESRAWQNIEINLAKYRCNLHVRASDDE